MLYAVLILVFIGVAMEKLLGAFRFVQIPPKAGQGVAASPANHRIYLTTIAGGKDHGLVEMLIFI
jgi:hypothetical protein